MARGHVRAAPVGMGQERSASRLQRRVGNQATGCPCVVPQYLLLQKGIHGSQRMGQGCTTSPLGMLMPHHGPHRAPQIFQMELAHEWILATAWTWRAGGGEGDGGPLSAQCLRRTARTARRAFPLYATNCTTALHAPLVPKYKSAVAAARMGSELLSAPPPQAVPSFRVLKRKLFLGSEQLPVHMATG